jgi:hypothetical protein
MRIYRGESGCMHAWGGYREKFREKKRAVVVWSAKKKEKSL